MKTTSRKWFTACVLGILFAGAAPSVMAECDRDKPGCSNTLQHEFAVDGGLLLVTNLQLFIQGSGFCKVVWTATNKSNLNLDRAFFTIRFFDKNSNDLGNALLSTKSLNIGESKEFTDTVSVFKKDGSPSNLNELAKVEFVNPRVFPSYKYVISLKKPKPSNDLSFEDKQVSFQFEISGGSILLNVTNKTVTPIIIDWNNLAYIDGAMDSHRIFHSGVKYDEREKTQASSMVPPGARIKDNISPTDYVSLLDSKWVQKDILPNNSKDALGAKGQSIGLFIPLEINAIKKYYSFTFSVDDVLIGQ